MNLVFHWAEKLARGCGWFALCVGVLLGGAFGFATQLSVSLDPNLIHQVLTHFLFGHLPTFLVSSFVLLRVSFQLTTESEMRVDWVQGQQAAAYSLACALVCLMAWVWFFLSAMLGCWLGMMFALNGYAMPVWDAFWFDFDLSHLFHAALRMLLLALSLSVMTLVEVFFLQARRHQLGLLMSRFMTIGMFLIVAIELLDVTLM
ncbi:hypothetical protein [Limnohabitans sp. Jir61]|jgi:hypothetical protein|uniref:hypothetical protein n=1 Tax=Limnohabitans sp. Jir61 TaxID=1826168 RepID=UPI0011B2645C|nr:hypothetical protein [Limnohabitans sp. Jir61]